MCEYWHPKFYLVKELISLLYDLDGCGAGGCCHIVTDDNNIYDSDLDFVIEYCDREENKNCIDKELSKTICTILKEMTFKQRSVLFWYIDLGIEFKNITKEDIDILIDMGKFTLEQIYKEADWNNVFYNE